MRAIELVSDIGHERTARTARTPLAGLRRGVAAAVATLRLWRQRRRDRGELSRLDDRMLRDIGLTRGDAEFLINKPFWRP